MSVLAKGTLAPEFQLQNQNGENVALSQYRGRPVVVYFYPKNETPGCVAEACGFRDQYEDFLEAGAEVIGISSDSVNSHARFAKGRKLPFQLLSDPGHRTAKAYGVKSSMLGLIPGRETFVIDAEGYVQLHFSSQLDIQGHIRQALEEIKRLA